MTDASQASLAPKRFIDSDSAVVIAFAEG